VTSELRDKKPKPKSGEKAQAPRESWEKTFVSCNLADEDKKAIRDSLQDFEGILTMFGQMLINGYKASFSYDARSDAVGCYCTQTDKKDRAYAYCLTARGPDMPSALASLVYKHYTMLDGIWDNEVSRNFESDQWA